jgi:hypothetical protein
MSLGVWDVNHFGAGLLGRLRKQGDMHSATNISSVYASWGARRRFADRAVSSGGPAGGDLRTAADPKSTARGAKHRKDSDRGEPKWSVQSPNCLARIFARYQGRPEIGRLFVMAAWTKTAFSPWFVRFGGQT